MNLTGLRSFVAVVEARSFTGAARSLRLAQSTVSTHVLALERSLGVGLINRSQGVKLTPAGEALLEYAHVILGTVEEARSAVENAGGGQGLDGPASGVVSSLPTLV